MKSLERRFKNISARKIDLSSFLCFSEAIKGQRFSRQTIHRWFYKLVDKEDYLKSEVRGVLEHLENLSNKLEDNKK